MGGGWRVMAGGGSKQWGHGYVRVWIHSERTGLSELMSETSPRSTSFTPRPRQGHGAGRHAPILLPGAEWHVSLTGHLGTVKGCHSLSHAGGNEGHMLSLPDPGSTPPLLPPPLLPSFHSGLLSSFNILFKNDSTGKSGTPTAPCHTSRRGEGRVWVWMSERCARGM